MHALGFLGGARAMRAKAGASVASRTLRPAQHSRLTTPAPLPPPLAAISKYGKGQATDDLPTAVTMLLEKNIIPNLVPGAVIQSNTFRSERLYHEEVDLVFKKHSVLLKALYSRYRLKPVGGGLRPKVRPPALASSPLHLIFRSAMIHSRQCPGLQQAPPPPPP